MSYTNSWESPAQDHEFFKTAYIARELGIRRGHVYRGPNHAVGVGEQANMGISGFPRCGSTAALAAAVRSSFPQKSAAVLEREPFAPDENGVHYAGKRSFQPTDSVSSLFGAAERPKLGPTFSRPFGATAGQRSHAGLCTSASAQQLTSSLTSSSSMSKMSFKSSTPLYSLPPRPAWDGLPQASAGRRVYGSRFPSMNRY